MAGESMREDSSNLHHHLCLRFPKTQASQTDLCAPPDNDVAVPHNDQDRTDYAAAVDSDAAAAESHKDDADSAEIGKQQARSEQLPAAAARGERRRGMMGWIRMLVGCVLALLLMFTYLCGFEYEGRVYYPITYRPLRFVLCPIARLNFLSYARDQVRRRIGKGSASREGKARTQISWSHFKSMLSISLLCMVAPR